MNQYPDCENMAVTSQGAAPAHASDELFIALYARLRRHARRQLHRMGMAMGPTLQPTGLVHEVYERLASGDDKLWTNRAQFLAVAYKAMQYILIDMLRRKRAVKHGGHMVRIPMDDVHKGNAPAQDEVLTLLRALSTLEKQYPEEAQVVVLRCVAGFTMDQIAGMSDVSRRTVERRWRFAKTWLRAQTGRYIG